jgi:hypothetical protein
MPALVLTLLVLSSFAPPGQVPLSAQTGLYRGTGSATGQYTDVTPGVCTVSTVWELTAEAEVVNGVGSIVFSGFYSNDQVTPPDIGCLTGKSRFPVSFTVPVNGPRFSADLVEVLNSTNMTVSGTVTAAAIVGTISVQYVRGYVGSDSGSFSLPAAGSAPGPGLPAPTNLRSQVSGTGVTVSWSAVAGAIRYGLSVGTGPGLANVFHGVIAGTTASGTAPAGTYYWRVWAESLTAASGLSQEAVFTVGSAAPCSPPSPPVNLTHTVTGLLITLRWSGSGSPPRDGASEWILEAGSGPGLSNLYQAPTGNSATELSVSAPPGTYYVRVRMRTSCGVSAPSNEQVIVVGSAPPASNRPPALTSPGCSFSGGPGSTQTCPASATDPDPGDLITWGPGAGHTCTWFGASAHVPSNPSTVTLFGTVPTGFTGTCYINLQICDQRGACTAWTGSYTWNTTAPGGAQPAYYIKQGLLVTEGHASNTDLRATTSTGALYGSTGVLTINWQQTITSGGFRTAKLYITATNDTQCDTYFNGYFKDADTNTPLKYLDVGSGFLIRPGGMAVMEGEVPFLGTRTRLRFDEEGHFFNCR